MTEDRGPRTENGHQSSALRHPPSFFDDPVAAQKLEREALSWVGTPFREYYQQDIERLRTEDGGQRTEVDLKGMGGGIDCIGLAQQIFLRIGASNKFVFARDPADYQSHQLGDKILNWLRGEVDDPQSKILASILIELPIPDKYLDAPRDFFKPGDILIMQHGGLFHMPVIYDGELHFVNAVPRLGVIEGTIQDATYHQHLVAVFRLRPRASADKSGILRSPTTEGEVV